MLGFGLICAKTGKLIREVAAATPNRTATFLSKLVGFNAFIDISLGSIACDLSFF